MYIYIYIYLYIYIYIYIYTYIYIIPNAEDLASLRQLLDARREKIVTTEVLVDLAKTFLMNNIFLLNEKSLK